MTPETSSGPAALIDALVVTLREECGAVEAVEAEVQAQLEALRCGQVDALEDHAAEAGRALSHVHRLQQKRQRQMRLIGRLLKVGEDAPITVLAEAAAALPGGAVWEAQLRDVRAQVQTKARAVQQQTETLEFTLAYAAKLSREVLAAWQDLQAPPADVYNAAGRTQRAVPLPSLLNQVG